jgi:hypothetical protein
VGGLLLFVFAWGQERGGRGVHGPPGGVFGRGAGGGGVG